MRFHFSRSPSINKIIISTLIVALILTSFGTIAQPYQPNIKENNQNSDIIQTKPTKIDSVPKTQALQCNIYTVSPDTLYSFSNDTSILPKQPYYIQQHPQIITDHQNVFVLAETHLTDTSPGQLTATYSTDQGETWTEQITISRNATSFTHPTLDYTGDPEMQAYGSHLLDANTGTQFVFGFPNITNPDTGFTGSTSDFDMYGWFNGRILTWDPSYWDQLGDTATAGYPHGTDRGPYKNFHGLTIWAGHDGTGWSYYYFCETDETTDKPYKFLWKNYLNGIIEHADIDIDLATGWEYDLYQIINGTTNISEIHLDMLYLEPGNPTWYNDDQNYGHSHIFKHYQNPSIKASNGYVYLVCEKNQDIYLHHSTDKGFTYTTTQLTNTTDTETQPKVTANGNSVTVTYVKNNNVYLITSTNGGNNWSNPLLINEQTHSVSMTEDEVALDGNAVCWTNTNATILFKQINIDTPIISINDITGGIHISATIQNKGMVDAINIPYSIHINQGILLTNREINGTITIPAGQTTPIQTTQPILGFGRTTITLQVGSISITKPATLYLFYMKL